jgi:1-pyrroline-5-carboxylate dehydrogenase
MSAGTFSVPTPVNEVVKAYAPGSAERSSLMAEVDRQADTVVEIPCVIGGEHVYTGNTIDVTMPCDHHHVLARVHAAGPAEIAASVAAAESARADWASLDWSDRAAVLLKAADLLAGPWRDRVNAATMIGQGKTIYQAEIDSAAELADFWRFNPHYAQQVYAEQPPYSPRPTWNRLEHRPLDGFVFAVTPFNFTSIAGNLPTAPALMGNTVVWKAATTSALSCWMLVQLLEEAGMPPGVINFVNGSGREIGDAIIPRPELAGLHFTGSTGTFQTLWKGVAHNLETYRAYPRLVGETGGKDFIVAHPSADPVALSVAILRGCFEYQGQKCSAASRLYIPKSLWPEVRDRVVAGMAEMSQGDVRDPSNFVAAVIDGKAFKNHAGYQRLAYDTADVVAGGGNDDSTGWYIHPTLVRVDDPRHRLMQEEIFGPVATVFVFEDSAWEETLTLVDTTSPYALTGALWARDRGVIAHAAARLSGAAGNFYINDKPTGAVVGQQPFGGGRASGTNDKAGSILNLLRWVSPRAIKETFVPPTDWRYPFMG